MPTVTRHHHNNLLNNIFNNRILIVEDEPNIREGYRSILTPTQIPELSSSRISSPALSPNPVQHSPSTLSFEIVEAESGENALKTLLTDLQEGRRFAGAIVDVRMPGKLDGLQFIQEAWKNDPDLIVVVATAYQDRSVDEIHRLFTESFQDQWDYLNKPFTAGEITQKARNLVSTWNRRYREKEYLRQIKEQQQALIGQEKLAAVGRLARSVGHEFGNILQPLISTLELTKEQVKLGELNSIESFVDEMLEIASLGANICQDLLTFSDENLNPKTQLNKVLIEPIIETSTRLLRHEIKKHDIHITTLIEKNLQGLIDESRLIQILVNLLKNALDALPDGGIIEIRGYSTPQNAVLEIKDYGCGISDTDLPKLFQPLFSTKGNCGNGIGLIACKQIMEEHGGEILIQSKLGIGTTVMLKFSL